MASPRMLSEPEAWREIARRLAYRQRAGEAETGFLCRHLDVLAWTQRRITLNVEAQMRRRIKAYLGNNYTAFDDLNSWPYSPSENRQGRLLAALWLALESESELAEQKAGR